MRLSDAARISLLTVSPGENLYAAFGHTALRVHDPVAELDYSFDYGTFDWARPNFIWNFIRGRLDYFLSVHRTQAMLRRYREEQGRAVFEQVLDLDATQRQVLFEFLVWNADPAHRVYRYDFFLDNCSTRPRDALEKVLGASLRFGPLPDPGVSFRTLVREHYAHRPFLALGIDLLLGSSTDALVGPREAAFAPELLEEACARAVLVRGAALRPLVLRSAELAPIGASADLDPAPPYPALITWALLVVAVLGWLKARRRGAGPWRGPDVLLLLAVGLAGVVIAAMWFATEHRPVRGNWNLLWAWPTHLPAALAVLCGARWRWLHLYLGAAAAIALGTALAWPFLPQSLPGAIFPLLLLLALRCGWRARGPAARR